MVPVTSQILTADGAKPESQPRSLDLLDENEKEYTTFTALEFCMQS